MAKRGGNPNNYLLPSTPAAVAKDSHGNGISVTPRITADETIDNFIEVTPETSLNLMKIASLAVFSQIALTRKLVPDDSAAQRTLYLDNSNCKYSDFMNSEPPNENSLTEDADHAVFNILERQKYPQVDKLMDWIENGAYDALAKGYLKSMRLTLFDTVVKADAVVESFELHFSEVDENNQNSTPSHLTCIQLSSAKKNARYLLSAVKRAFSTFFYQPDAKPDQIAVSMQLTHTQKCLQENPEYQPPGFRDLQDHRILHAGKRRVPVGDMSTGQQSILVEWFHNNGDDQDSRESPRDILAIDTPRVKPKRFHSSLSQEPSSQGTSSCQREDRTAIRGMAMPRDMLNDEADTQCLSNLSQLLQQSSNISELRQVQELATNYVFSQKIVDMLLKDQDETMDIVSSKENLGNTGVTCECNVKVRDPIMLQCRSCFYYQHFECYGYSDDKKPELHFCYKCLLQDNDPDTMSNLRSLALRRRALQYMVDCGYPQRKSDLQKYLGCNFTVLNRLNEELRIDGYLQPNPEFNPKLKKAKIGEFIFNDTMEQMQKLKNTYRDPSTHIAHLMELPVQSDDLGESNETTQTTRFDDMSSTQGTPSPIPSSFRPSSLLNSSSPRMLTQSNMLPPVTPVGPGRKRPLESFTVNDRFKRVKNTGASSPFLSQQYANQLH